ncbi:Nitrogenase component 1 type Oxidoreductase [Lachnospiraceae bacterium NK3A20]|nr:Nitrogenase component 1 type Oxidoreductase [Lachnospiraceae bacterium NK3A20]
MSSLSQLQPHRNGARVRIADAAFPKPFPWQLEYNCPVHEHWNIVHTGMLIPETHAVYVCSDNCLRGVIMTADEWNGESRFSAVMPTEKDTVDGKLETVTIEGVARVIERLPYRPKAMLVFLVCMHHFLACDEKYIYRELERRFPDIHFLRCWMDPIMQKIGLTPEQKQRREMMLCIEGKQQDPAKGCVLGDDYRLPGSSDIVRLLAAHGITLHQTQDAKTYEEYQNFGDAAFYLTRSPLSVYGLNKLAQRDGRRQVYLPPAATYKEITKELEELLSVALPKETHEAIRSEVRAFATEEIAACEAAFDEAREKIGDTQVTLDYIGCVRPLSTARLLLSHGIRVTCVYLDAILPEEQADFDWLRENAPDLILQSTSQAEALVLPRRENASHVLAIGPKAAYFSNTRHFVNQIESAGNWGFDGIRKLLQAMCCALEDEKDTEAIVQRKGLRKDGSYGCQTAPLSMREGEDSPLAWTGENSSLLREVKASSLQQQGEDSPPQRSNPGVAGVEPVMKEAYRATPVYAGDVSGVCSALYELGGMVVMHDPSGCNSTYNTHDETRWYRTRSSIYISGLNERDAILGNDAKFIQDILDAVAEQEKTPKFIALCNSPVPFLNGTDFTGIAKLLEKKTGIPSFYVQTNGFHDYIIGEQNAFLAYAQKMLPAKGAERHCSRVRVGILGMTPLDYGNPANVSSLTRLLTTAGFDVVSRWSYGSSHEDAQNILHADVLLVISAAGKTAAEYLEKECGIPAVYAAPIPGLETETFAALRAAAQGEPYPRYVWRSAGARPALTTGRRTGNGGRPDQNNGDADTARTLHETCIIGEPVLAQSLAAVLRKRGEMAHVACLLEGCDDFLDTEAGDCRIEGEEGLMAYANALRSRGQQDTIRIIADPYMRVILPEEFQFTAVPTLAYSGRIDAENFPNYFGSDADTGETICAVNRFGDFA